MDLIPCREYPLEKEMPTYSSILAWRIPWTEGPDGLQSKGLQRVEYDLATKKQQTSIKIILYIIKLYNTIMRYV